MNGADILARLSRVNLSEYDASTAQTIEAWVHRVQTIESIKAAGTLDVIKELIAKYESEVKTIESTLLNSRELKELDRLNLLDKKELYESFINTFNVDNSFEKLSAEIDNLL